jgi:hypothetical protein
LSGTVIDPAQRDAARVAAEIVSGVKAVTCHIVWVEPMSGMAFPDPEEDAGEAKIAGSAWRAARATSCSLCEL